MKKTVKFLCFVMIVVCMVMSVPTAYAAQQSVAMWDMEKVESVNTVFVKDFTDSFGNAYQGAVCFDVALGSKAEYDLSGQYSSFTGTLATSGETNSAASFNFAIVLDGQIAYVKQGFTRQSVPEKIVLDLTGAKTMQILTSTNYGAYTYVYVANGSFCCAEQPTSTDAPAPHKLTDVTLVDSLKYNANDLVEDSFGNVHANNYIFGKRETAYAVYNLDGNYNTLNATVFAGNDFGGHIVRSCSVYCDGKLVVHHENIDRQTTPIDIEVDVRHVSVLKIETTAQTSSAWDNEGMLIVGDVRLMPHIHTPGTVREDVAPTCTQEGKKNYTCTVCGKVCNEEIIAASGHVPGDWVTEKKPTCMLVGLKHKYCQVCGEVAESEKIPLLEHTSGTEWIVLTEATCYNGGTEALPCQVCGIHIEERSIPEKAHQMGEWKKEEGSIWNAPIQRVRSCENCYTAEYKQVYAFAWFKPLVLCIVLALVLLGVLCYTTAIKTCEPIIKKHGLIYVLRAAFTLKEDEIITAVSNLREDLADTTDQQ